MTASWRASGTLSLFVVYGVKLLSPHLFVLIAFLASAATGYIIGTSFGVAGIMGAVFMTIGASGNVNPALTAGAILSGIYFGDRTSPMSSSFLTIQSITHFGENSMLKELLRDGLPPLMVCIGLYGGLSFLNPLQNIDDSVISGLSGLFSLSPWCLLPAIIVLLFPVLSVKTWILLLLSMGISSILAMGVQGMTLSTFIRTCIWGYECPSFEIGKMFNGGGMISMVEICFIVAVSTMLTTVIRAGGIEKLVRPFLETAVEWIGISAVTTIGILLMNGIFCNQSASLYLADTCLNEFYPEKRSMVIDLSDSNVLAAMIPWNLCCSVPLAFMGADISALPFAFFIYLAPMINCLRGKRHLRSTVTIKY
ncbi:MAG: hypothetical protein HFE73_06130 [Firmicutes bacterium]|nr:hypothetical protein [Bacillota bacterium]